MTKECTSQCQRQTHCWHLHKIPCFGEHRMTRRALILQKLIVHKPCPPRAMGRIVVHWPRPEPTDQEKVGHAPKSRKEKVRQLMLLSFCVRPSRHSFQSEFVFPTWKSVMLTHIIVCELRRSLRCFPSFVSGPSDHELATVGRECACLVGSVFSRRCWEHGT